MSNPVCPSSATAAAPLDFAALHAVEDHHFWFQERNRVLAAVIDRLTCQLAHGYRVLEVGCGTGNVLRMLEDVCCDGEVIGTDLFDEGLVFARRRCRCAVVQADIFDLPFTEPFEVIGLFDVLEHLPDDRGALEALHAALVPGGALVLTVPAHQALWSYADEYAGHYRRYAASDLLELLERTGFQVEYCTPFMAALYPLLWLGRRWASLWNDRRPVPDSRDTLFARELQLGRVVNRLLTWLHHWETPVIARQGKLPWGVSLLAVARKSALTHATAICGQPGCDRQVASGELCLERSEKMRGVKVM
jgi:SAM-dependent methyltransferase